MTILIFLIGLGVKVVTYLVANSVSILVIIASLATIGNFILNYREYRRRQQLTDQSLAKQPPMQMSK